MISFSIESSQIALRLTGDVLTSFFIGVGGTRFFFFLLLFDMNFEYQGQCSLKGM